MQRRLETSNARDARDARDARGRLRVKVQDADYEEGSFSCFFRSLQFNQPGLHSSAFDRHFLFDCFSYHNPALFIVNSIPSETRRAQMDLFVRLD